MAATPLPARSRVLLGPGPSEMPQRVAAALASPAIGYLDPLLLKILDETRDLLRRLYQTSNPLTLPVSATGTGGMEACLVNLVEPGDRVLVGTNGLFGGRIADAARRLGAEVATVEAAWGCPLDPDRVAARIRETSPALVAVVHAETSTGVLQTPDEMRRIGTATRESGALLLVDCVTSLGGVPVEPDSWPADACFSASQKCLSGPTGLSPVTLNERAGARMRARRASVPSFYFDLTLIERYWNDHAYHHTTSSPLILALLESLRLVFEEACAVGGAALPARFARHLRHRDALIAGLQALELSPLVRPEHRLPMLTTVGIPAEVDGAAIRSRLLEEDGIEIGSGFGPLAGKIWRIGLMGHSSRPENILLLLEALGRRLSETGRRCDPGEAQAAARAVLEA